MVKELSFWTVSDMLFFERKKMNVVMLVDDKWDFWQFGYLLQVHVAEKAVRKLSVEEEDEINKEAQNGSSLATGTFDIISYCLLLKINLKDSWKSGLFCGM